MPQPILYSFRRCPFAMRARMALFNSGIRVELREVMLSKMPEALLLVSPKSTVPVLQLADGRVIDESLDIMRWALSIADPNHWLADSPTSDMLIEQCDNEFKPLLDYYKYADRHTELSQLDHRHNALPFLRMLNDRLQRHAFLIDDQIKLADIAIMPFIRQFAGVEPKWFAQSEYTSLRHWLVQLIETSLFQTIMHKYAVWQDDSAPVFLG